MRTMPMLAAVVMLCGLFSAAAAATGRPVLSWTDDDAVQGFYVERATATGSPLVCGAFTRIATTGSKTYQDVDAALLAGGSYCYRVNAYNSVGPGPYSNAVMVTLPSLAAPALSVIISP